MSSAHNLNELKTLLKEAQDEVFLLREQISALQQELQQTQKELQETQEELRQTLEDLQAMNRENQLLYETLERNHENTYGDRPH